jgi:hypothetical protein
MLETSTTSSSQSLRMPYHECQLRGARQSSWGSELFRELLQGFRTFMDEHGWHHGAVEQSQAPNCTSAPLVLEFIYSLQFILIDSNMDVYRHILVLDTSIIKSTNMDRRSLLTFSVTTTLLYKAQNFCTILVFFLYKWCTFRCVFEKRKTVLGQKKKGPDQSQNCFPPLTILTNKWLQATGCPSSNFLL